MLRKRTKSEKRNLIPDFSHSDSIWLMFITKALSKELLTLVEIPKFKTGRGGPLLLRAVSGIRNTFTGTAKWVVNED